MSHSYNVNRAVLLSDFMRERFGQDVSIEDIHRHVYGDVRDNTAMQRRIGVVLSRFNRTNTQKLVIKPGDLKQTYRMTIAE